MYINVNIYFLTHFCVLKLLLMLSTMNYHCVQNVLYKPTCLHA